MILIRRNINDTKSYRDIKTYYLSDMIHFLLFSLKENDVQVQAFRCMQILAQDSEPLTFLNVKSFL